MTGPRAFDRNGVNPLMIRGQGAELPMGPAVDPMADPMADPLAQLEGEVGTDTIALVEEMQADLRTAEGQALAEERPAPKPLVLMAVPMEPEARDRRRRAISSLYGDGFPLLDDQPSDDDWADWAEELEQSGKPMQRPAVHRARRNRFMRLGVQWISSRREGEWEVPAKPSSKVRATVNMIGPALDWRLQVQTEQRPGVKVVPLSNDADDRSKATSNQRLIEFQYRAQTFNMVRREAAYWAQTDGVAFLHTFWDPKAGPLMRDPQSGQMTRAGDPTTEVVTLEHVVVSPNATAIRKPFWWVVTEELPKSEAINVYGDDVVDEGTDTGAGGTRGRGIQHSGGRASDRAAHGASEQLGPDRERLRGQVTVTKRTIYCEPSEYLPNGLTLVVVGRKVVFLYGLLCGRVPVVPYRDGTTDPAFFPRAKMEEWLDDQVLLNGTYSKLLTNIARNAGGRYAYRAGSVRPDTILGGQDVLIEVRTTADIQNALMPVQGFSIGTEALGVIEGCIKRLEDRTGFNEVARGSSTQESGRAILAVREQLERTFAPSVYAECEGVKGWARVTMAFCAAFYEVPRAIRTLGKSRPDLGRLITKDDLDGTADVELEPESMMPLPSSERSAVLKERLGMGLITPAEFRRRDRYGFLDDLETPDELHAGRCYRFIDAVRQDPFGGDVAEPMLWQDDEAIWQDLLERELILAADVPPEQRSAAIERWNALAGQAMEKAQASPMGGVVPSPWNPQDPERGALAPQPMMAGAPMGAPGEVPMAPAGSGAPSGSTTVDPASAASGQTAAMPPSPSTVQSDAARRFEQRAPQ